MNIHKKYRFPNRTAAESFYNHNRLDSEYSFSESDNGSSDDGRDSDGPSSPGGGGPSGGGGHNGSSFLHVQAPARRKGDELSRNKIKKEAPRDVKTKRTGQVNEELEVDDMIEGLRAVRLD